MQKNRVTICGLNCDVVHLTRVQTAHPFPPAKLRDEIARRAGYSPHHYRSQYVHVKLHDFGPTFAAISEKTRNQTYDLTFAHLDVLDDILSIIEEIERDVDRELESQRILGLLNKEP